MTDIMESTISKIRLLGNRVLLYNSFGVVYKTPSGDNELLKITYTPDGRVTGRDIVKGFFRYNISEHFIYLQYDYGRNQCAIYVKTSNRNLIKTYARVIIYYNSNGVTMLDGALVGKAPIILYKTISRRTYALNYLGDRIEITKYKPEDIMYDFVMQLSPDNTRVKMGHGKLFTSATENYLGYFMSDMLDWFIDTDIEFKNIVYNT